MSKISISLFILLLAACSSTPKNNVPLTCSIEDEKFMAKEALIQIRRDFPALQNENIQAYVSELGQSLVKNSQLDGNPYTFTFTVVNTPDVHAFSLPAGSVFISKGLLGFVDSEDELAGILSHEIAHIVQQHSAKRMADLKNQKSRSWWYGGGGAVVGGAVGIGVASAICMNNHLCSAQLVGFGAAGGIYSGLFLQKYAFLKQSQENELSADQMGFEITQRAGLNPKKISDFYGKIEQIKNKKNVKAKTPLTLLVSSLSTHPTSEKRLAQIEQLSSNTSLNLPNDRGTERFDFIKKQFLVQ